MTRVPTGAAPAQALARRMATRLKMKHLLLLQAIGEHRTLTRVAQHLATSQPAVTQHLAELESLFGAPLFRRLARGMEPTDLGELVLARARAMLADLDHWAEDIQAVDRGRAAHLHVGVIPFVPGRLLVRAIEAARPQGRRLTITVHENTSDHLLAALRAHTLDCVIGRVSSVLDMAGLQHRVLYEQEPRLIASRRLARWLDKRPLAWDALTNFDWVLGARNTPMREQITDFFLRAGVAPPPPLVESLSAKVIGELVAANEQALSIVPADIAEELVRIAGVGIVRHRFGWTLPPITLFERTQGARYEEQAMFTQALLQAAQDMAAAAAGP